MNHSLTTQEETATSMSKKAPWYAASINALTAMSEYELQSKIVEPLLRILNFKAVRDSSGANDRGKDLVAVRYEFGKPKLYAIQIKKFMFSGKHSKTEALTRVLTQLDQIFSEPVIDPVTEELKHVDQCYFITPYPIHRDALMSAISKKRELERRGITIIDGVMLVDQVLEHMPEALRVNMDIQYRMRLAEDSNIIKEARAFGGNSDIRVDAIYVDLSLGYHDVLFDQLAHHRSIESPIVIDSSQSDIDKCKSICVQIVGRAPPVHEYIRSSLISSDTAMAVHVRLKKREEQLEDEIHAHKIRLYSTTDKLAADHINNKLLKLDRSLLNLRERKIFELDILPVMHIVQKLCANYLRQFHKLVEGGELKSEAVKDIIARGIALRNNIQLLLDNNVIYNHWPSIGDVTSKDAESVVRGSIKSGSLLNLRHCVFITGGAGTGKTTLLRHLSRIIAQIDKKKLPVFLPLSRASFVSARAVIPACVRQLRKMNYRTTPSELCKAVSNGDVFLLFDGLDERGQEAPAMLRAIMSFCRQYPDCPVFVTSRLRTDYPPWDEALHVRTSVFNDAQQITFVKNWFAQQPTSHAGLISWLNDKKNARMRDIVRTPIHLVQLCVLYRVDAHMPSTEAELYSGRFSLFLGEWEEAKGFDPLSVTLRKRYEIFLMKLAYEMHIKGARSIPYQYAIRVAQDYYDEIYHVTPVAMIDDCINRNLLFSEAAGDLSFGHLTYQEYMAAQYMDKYCDAIAEIWKRIDNAWWHNPIRYYAAIKADITNVLAAAPPNARIPHTSTYKFLEELVNLAPLTPKRSWIHNL